MQAPMFAVLYYTVLKSQPSYLILVTAAHTLHFLPAPLSSFLFVFVAHSELSSTLHIPGREAFLAFLNTTCAWTLYNTNPYLQNQPPESW